MFLRIVKARGGGGVQHEYVRLVEAYRENGKSKQRVVANLGRKELLSAHLDSLVRLLRGETGDARTPGEPRATGAWDWGPMLVISFLWRYLGLEAILDKLDRDGTRYNESLADRALVLVANRLCAPTSEHGLARWLETDFVCDRSGRRWLPEWRDDGERLLSRLPRVRVRMKQLKMWYRTLDQLVAHKPTIEQELFLRLRDLFSLKVDLAFYDLTSTYFEGHGPPTLGAHGYSRDHRPRDRQVLVGVVIVDGWPIFHQVLRGNIRDSKTVPDVIANLQHRFGLRRVIFVGDRGMVTSDNLKELRRRKYGYILGLNRRRNEKIQNYISRTTDKWIDCPPGITGREKSKPTRTRVQEVAGDEPNVRIFVVESEERLEYEKQQRTKSMDRVKAQLERLEKRVQSGRLKQAEKIGAAAARILGRNHGHRYFDWSYQDGKFRFFDHPVNLARETSYEGKYIIQTEEKDLSPIDAVRIYKELSDVERAFASLKDVIEMRPIYHRTDERVEAHIFVAALALLIHRCLERLLKKAKLDFSATEALQVLRTVRVVEFEIDGAKKAGVTGGSERAARILSALGISDRHPPVPPETNQTDV